MEDNDLRGFLDGAYKYAWNQSGQVHVRLGRREGGIRYAEYELFRVLQIWNGIRLPPGAEVRRAELALQLETPRPDATRVYLYSVSHDFEPGAGGTLGNNTSPPRPGEVWWNDRAYPDAPWSLPGASYASDDSLADTGVMPLAVAVAPPGERVLRFSSPDLARYVTARVHQTRPLLFLLKLADSREDEPGPLVCLYSGNHGDHRSPLRRPRLALTWNTPSPLVAITQPLLLEHGRRRRISLPVTSLPPGETRWVAASVVTRQGSESPALRWILHDGSEVDATIPQAMAELPVALEVTSAAQPLQLGETFESELRDTWIRTAAPEKQAVVWTFRSPTGRLIERRAAYQGDWRWTISFTPDEPGRWQVQWTESFVKASPYASGVWCFDVLADDRAAVESALAALAVQIQKAGLTQRDPDALPCIIRLMRLERALVQAVGPAEYRDESGAQVRATINQVRAALRAATPDSIPMVPDAPPQWARSPAR